MDQTTVTLLMALGGAAIGVAAIAGGYLVAQAAIRDADAAFRAARAAPRPAAATRRPRFAAPAVQGAKMTREQRELQMVELQRTRTILLGLLNVLEAVALGETSRATAARAELADVGDCDISLLGDADLVDTYLLTAEMLRTRIGQGLPADAASQVASLRVRLLTALAQQERGLSQERRLLRGEEMRRAPLLAIGGVAVAVAAGAAVGRLPLGGIGVVAFVTSLVLVGVVAAAGRQRSLMAIGVAVYILALHWTYTDWIAPVYGYAGMVDAGASWPSLLLVSLLAILPVIWLPVVLRRPSGIVLWVLYLLGYVPATVLPIHLLGPDLGAVLPLEIAITLAFATLAVCQRVPRPTRTWPGVSERSFDRLLLTLGCAAGIYLVVVFGIPTELPALGSVYTTRADYGVIESGSPLAGYLVPWAGNVIFPVLLTLGLVRRRPPPLILGAGGLLLVYGITGAKTALFSIVLVVLLYLAARYGARAFGTLLAWGTVAILWLSVAATAGTGSIWPLALFPTRVLAVTGQLTAYYYQFFSTHATYQLSDSFLRWFSNPPYDLSSARLMGTVYFGTSTTFANANIWADAMSQFGLAGILVFTIVLGCVLWALDVAGTGRDLTVIGPTLGVAGFTLAQGALFTSILTFGIALTIALLAFMPANASSDHVDSSEGVSGRPGVGHGRRDPLSVSAPVSERSR
jgi:hypothetical protein